MQLVRQAGMTSPCYAHHAQNAYKAAMNLSLALLLQQI